MAKLVAIGDSLTQGFQSGAILRTELSYPALMAKALGLTIPTQFAIPHFPGSGLPLNIEEALRSMEQPLGQEISSFEWIVRFPVLLNQFVDAVEDLYERGAGASPASFGGSYHNLAVWGFRVMDSFAVTYDYSQNTIQREEGWIENDFFGLPSAPMYRTAQHVLNPNFRAEKANWTQLDNLRNIIQTDGQLEALVLWLGANDCLGTVMDLEMKDMTSADVDQMRQAGTINDPVTRRNWNLTNLDLFRQDFTELTTQIAQIIPPSTQVFVGTIPYVTIPPVTQGIGAFHDRYFDYYGRFYATAENFDPTKQPHLRRDQVMAIDQRIDAFNSVIREMVGQQGHQWQIVDIGEVLNSLAVKRNDSSNAPGTRLIEYYTSKGWPDHPLLQLNPVPSVLRLDTRNSTRLQGGLFSLDCIHPTTIGYGIVAEEFLTAMQAAGVAGANPLALDWDDIIRKDTLLQVPPVLWDDIIQAAESHADLWNLLFSFLT